MDEDGQHDPADIPRMLDVAMAEQAPLVYAEPTNPPPHGWLRNAASRGAKWLFVQVLSSGDVPLLRELPAGARRAGTQRRRVRRVRGLPRRRHRLGGRPVRPAAPCSCVRRGARSGYSFRRLLSHFWRLVISSGTRTLRLVSATGVVFALLGFVLAGLLPGGAADDRAGRRRAGRRRWWPCWSASGMVLFALGVIAEYVGVAVSMAMGKPPYLIATDVARGPLGRKPLDLGDDDPPLLGGRSRGPAGLQRGARAGERRPTVGPRDAGHVGRSRTPPSCSSAARRRTSSTAADGGPWQVAWCAGAGVTATTPRSPRAGARATSTPCWTGCATAGAAGHVLPRLLGRRAVRRVAGPAVRRGDAHRPDLRVRPGQGRDGVAGARAGPPRPAGGPSWGGSPTSTGRGRGWRSRRD